MHNLTTDLRHVLRQARRTPGFAATVILTIAITIGATTTLFSLYNALVLRSLPVSDPSRIVVVQPIDDKGQNRPLYHDTYVELAKLSVFEHLALYSGGGLMVNEARGVRAEGLIEAVTPGFFETLGLRPYLGRFFVERDFTEIDSPSVVISYRMWQRLYGSDPGAIGDRIVINAHPMTVIGVTPPGFNGFYVDAGFGFSVPITVLNRYLGSDAKRPLRGLQAVGRLKADVPISQAQASVRAAWSSLRTDAVPSQLPAAERRDIANSNVKVETLSGGFSSLRTQFARPLSVLFGATVLLLLIGCVNMSGLLLARTAARDHQYAILQALGAPRARFIRQVLTEGIVLSLLGTAVALPFAWWGAAAITGTIWSGRDPIALRTSPDAGVVLITVAGALVIGVMMSALPAARAARRHNIGLGAWRTVTQSLGFWGRGLLVVQIALSLVLLVGAGLFARTLWNLRHLDAGFDRPDVRWSRLFRQPGADPPKDFVAHYTSMLRRIEELPQVESVAMSGMFPTFFNASQFLTRYTVSRVDASAADDSVGSALMETVTPQFFETVGIPRLQGRDFSWSDAGGAPRVAIISQSLSFRLFGQTDALGQRLRIGTDPKRGSVEVVGVVGDASIGALRDPHAAVVYLPRLQETMQTPVLLYRAAADIASTQSAI